MTLKQITKEIKTNRSDLAREQKNLEEAVAQNLPAHVIEYTEKWIAYHTKRIAELEAMIPEAARAEEEKLLKKIAKQQIKDKASTISFIESGRELRGVTPDGKRWYAERNMYGYTERGLHCFSLRIEGMGILFTSGTLDKVIETVAQN
jgi:hypothetical protein